MGTAEAQTDRLMDRAYRRIGWRILLVFLLTLWAVGFAVPEFALIAIAPVFGWTSSELIQVSAWWFVIVCGCITLSLLHAVHACRPLRRFARGDLDADQAWRDVVALQASFLKANVGLAILAMVPGFLNVAQVEPISLEIAGTFVLMLSGLTIYVVVGALFLMPAFIRPILRAISEDIDGNAPPVSGWLLTNRLLILVPGLGASMAVAGASVGIGPGTDPREIFEHIAVAIVISTLAMVPMTVLVVRAVKEPIEDLLEGTRRLRQGDYTVRVPELSSDELGDLARSFNDAMDGLADRQKLARDKVQLLDEVRASRTRIVEAADASRQRIERNLHDGAQQRLVALALDLQLLRESAPSMNTAAMDAALGRAVGDVKDALAELRDLARGLHPSVLTTDGLAYALDQLAARAKLPVTVEATAERFPPAVETAAYFVAAEALANVTKYAHASQARVSAALIDGELTIEIADDGIGGATLGEGTGLAGLADRVAALDGSLRIDSPVGRGTKVVAHIPLSGRVSAAPSAVEVGGGSS